MLGIHGYRAAERTGKPAGTRRQPGTVQHRLRRLRRAASVFAVVVPVASIGPIVVGFALPGVAVLLVVGWIAVWWWGNQRTITPVSGQALPPKMPWFRLAMGAIGGVAVALAVPLCVLNPDIEALQASQDPGSWDAGVQRLQSQRQSYHAVLTEPAPDVETDSAVIRLQGLLDKTNGELIQARKAVLCEQDGTCGTRVPGKANAYYDKLKYQQRLEQDVTDLKKQLATAKTEVENQAETLKSNQESAVAELPKIDEQLAALGSVRPVQLDRFPALLSIAKARQIFVGLATLAGLTAFTAVDVLMFLIVIRRIFLHPKSDKNSSVRSAVNDQSDKDESTRGAIPAKDLPLPMRSAYGISSRQVSGDDS